MNNYHAKYQQKLTTPKKAVESIENGSTIVHGLSIAELPALPSAIADRARAGDLKDIKIFSLLPLQHAAETVLSPDLSDYIQTYSWFVSGSSRSLVQGRTQLFRPKLLPPDTKTVS